MEDNQPQLHQQFLVHNPDEIMRMHLSPETIQQAPLPTQPSILPMMPLGTVYPYQPAQPFQMLYPADLPAVYPGSLIPEHQYAYCYYPTAAYHPMQAVQHTGMQQQPPTSGNAKTTPANGVTQGAYTGLVPAGTAAVHEMPVPALDPSGNSGYPSFQAFGHMSLVPQQLMPCFCCSQTSLQHHQHHRYQQPQLLHSQQIPQQDCRLQTATSIEACYTDRHPDEVSPQQQQQQQQSYTELYHQQQLLNDTARLEANFEDDYQLQQQDKPMNNRGLQQNHTPVNRRRNGYMHNILYKTELCRDVQEKGACPRGKTCQFAHTEAELHDPTKHPLYKTAFCFDFKNRGFCPRGPHCFHVHDVSELKTPPPFFSQQQQQQPQQLMQSSTSSTSRSNSNAVPTSRLPRSSRMRRRQHQSPMHQQQRVDEAPGPSHDRRTTTANKEQPQPSGHQSAASADTPFNFLMKKLQQQHQEKSGEAAATGVVELVDKIRPLRLNDAWNLEPVRAAQ